MKYRILGSTNLKVSVIGIGTWQFGGEWAKDFSQDEATAILRRGKDLGINFIDTAECYGDHLSESLIGNATANERDQWIIATKFGHKFHGPFQRTEPRTANAIRIQLEASLRALRTHYIDLYQYHSWGDAQFESNEVRRVLEDAIRDGKVRHVGNSISSNENIHQTDFSTAYHVEAIQVIYNRINRKPEAAVFPSCQRQNIGVLARVPLASGLLSGKYKAGTKFDNPADFRHTKKQEEIDDTLREVEEIQRTELPPGTDMAQYALAWCLKHPVVTCVIPGCKSVAQVEANAGAAELVTE